MNIIVYNTGFVSPPTILATPFLGVGSLKKTDVVSNWVKRDPYAFGLGKRSLFTFGPSKKDPYAFGLGKRSPGGSVICWGGRRCRG